MILFLDILKILGIILLGILGFLLLLLLCVLFIPIRYRLNAKREYNDNEPVTVDIKVSWLLHFITMTFSYPLQKYIKLKLFGITLYSSENKAEQEKQLSPKGSGSEKDDNTDATFEKKPSDKLSKTENADLASGENFILEEDKLEDELEKKLLEDIEDPTVIKFIKKLFELLKNIKYTIFKIYDKIKKIIKEIRYYTSVIRSNCFNRAFSLCKTELLMLVISILPKKIKGNFIIGTGDPASTAQILAIHGMLYPIIGNHINIIPDFDNTIYEGDLFIKGKITVFKVLKTAIKIYFNKDLRRVIQLLKREAA